MGYTDEHYETVCCCALNRIFGFRPRTAMALIGHIGSASGIFALQKDEIEGILGSHSAAAAQICQESIDRAEKEIKALEAGGYGFIRYGSEEYPERLAECEDAPAGLYVRSGTPFRELFAAKDTIAVVGTRDLSGYGREWCERIVTALASSESKPVIVSGLAFGADITAHMTALGYGLPTFAVMATGIDRVYPAAHTGIAGKISTAPGSALITDYPPGTHPAKVNFIRRNRIIAGLCNAVILVESKSKGGGMLTARLAFSYSRDVFALPGRIDDGRSMGCNILIKEGIACPIISETDLMESIGLGAVDESTGPDMEERVRSAFPELGEGSLGNAVRMAKEIERNRGIAIEELARISGLGYREALETVRILENGGFIDTDLMQRCYIRLK